MIKVERAISPAERKAAMKHPRDDNAPQRKDPSPGPVDIKKGVQQTLLKGAAEGLYPVVHGRKRSLVEFLRSSPLVGIDLDLERIRESPGVPLTPVLARQDRDHEP